MENILNVVSIFGKKIDWELDTALFWLFIVQAALVVFLVIVFAVLLHRVGKNRPTVIVRSTAETADKDAPNKEEQKLAEDALVADEKPAETEDATKEDAQPEEAADEEEPCAEEHEEPPTSEESEDAVEPETDATCEEQPESEATCDERPETDTTCEEQPADEQTDEAEQEPETEATCEEQPEAEATCEEQPEAETTCEEQLEAEAEQQEESQCEEEAPEETPVFEETEPEEEPAQENCDEAASDDIALQEEQEGGSCATDESEDEDGLGEEEALEHGVLRYNKSFTARLILSDDDIKTWYTRLKNELLSYKKVKSRISWKRETFRLGRKVVASFGFRGHTLCVYLPLDPADYQESKFKVEDVSDQVVYTDTPCMYRLKNQKRVRYSEELFAAVMEKLSGVRIDRASVDYYLPYESIDALLEKGLVKCVVKNSADEAIFLHHATQEQTPAAPADAEATPDVEPAQENAVSEDMSRIDAEQPPLEESVEMPFEQSSEAEIADEDESEESTIEDFETDFEDKLVKNILSDTYK